MKKFIVNCDMPIDPPDPPIKPTVTVEEDDTEEGA